MPPDTGHQGHNRQAKRGIKLLAARQVVLQILTFAGGVVLARTLDPSVFGLYVIASFLVSLFAMVGDFGLAPSLIQRTEALTDLDLQVGFTLQQVLTVVIVLALWVSAPLLAGFYPGAPPETAWLVRALSLNLFLASWQTMSKLQLERDLKYDRLSVVEVVGVLIYQGLAVGLALAGFGVWSFIWATLASGLVGAALMYAVAPWRVRFAYDRKIARDLIRYGVPFQSQGILNAVGGWVTPVVIGRWIGADAVGLLTWASSNGRKPLILVDSTMRVAFPHFARVQHDAAEVNRLLVRYLTYLALPAGLWFAAIATAAYPIVEAIYTAKWVPAVPALILFAAAMAADLTSWTLCIACNALGRVKLTMRVLGVRSAVNILLGVGLVLALRRPLGSASFVGVAAGYFLSATLAIPWLAVSGFGRQTCREVGGALAWVALPVIAACAAGWVAAALAGQTLAPLPPGGRHRHRDHRRLRRRRAAGRPAVVQGPPQRGPAPVSASPAGGGGVRESSQSRPGRASAPEPPTP